MRFFMFPIIVALVLSGCDKQPQEEEKAPVVMPPAAVSTPPPSPEAVVVPQVAVPQPKDETPPTVAVPPVSPVSAPATSIPSAPVKAPAPAPVHAPVKATPKAAPEPVVAAAKPDALVLAKQSGCLACHSVDKKIVGPAWKDVSARYKNDTEAKAKLIAKIKAGGKGNWTEVTGGMAMPPYSPRVSDHDIETLVDFVLSLAH